MATTNHVRLNNIAPTSGSSTTNWIWSLTRAMKKAGWKFKASSDGTTKVSSGDPAADQWGSGVVSNAGGALASIAAPTRGRANVTGLSGIVAADKGRFLTISGGATSANNNHHQIEEVISATEVRIDARQFAVASDANNGALTWTVRAPELETTYPSLETNAAWWCAQGPSILRIPFTVAATGTFIRGENITQASTGAEGELLGYTFSAGVGYLNVAPRLRGTGAGRFGWDTGNVITGANSGATLTQNGTAIEYVYEVVFAKPAGATSVLQFLVGQFDTAADSIELFSFKATRTGCTAAVHPGGGGTGNALAQVSFRGWVAWGTGSAPGAGVAIQSVTAVRAHVICVDAIPEEDYSADGSFSLIYSFVTTGNPDGFSLLGLHRLNDTEDADFSPYVSVNHGGVKAGLHSHPGPFASAGTAPTIPFSQGGLQALQIPTTRVAFHGTRRRGLSGEISPMAFEPCILYGLQSGVAIQSINSTDVTRVATSPDSTLRIREPIWLISAALNGFGTGSVKVFKGTLKWLYVFAGEQATDVFGTDPAWVQLGNISPGTIIGPHDGTAWVLNN